MHETKSIADIMEEQNSNGKIHVIIFALIIIFFPIGIFLGLSYRTHTHDDLVALSLSSEAIHHTFINTSQCAEDRFNAFCASSTDSENTEKAKKLHELSQKLSDDIMKLRFDLIAYTEGNSDAVVAARASTQANALSYISASEIKQPGAYDSPMQFLLGNGDLQESQATKLKLKLREYKTALLYMVPTDRLKDLEHDLSFLNTDEYITDQYREDEPWEYYYFKLIILVTAAMELETMANDVRMAEIIVLKYL